MSLNTSTIRIGNAQAFWGDRSKAAAELVAQAPELDYLTLDYLAEVSMSILAVQRERDPSAGYARDFVDVVRSLAPYWAGGGKCRLITNAGGLNPKACAQECIKTLEEAGCRSIRIGIVTGDDVLDEIRTNLQESSFNNLDTGAPIDAVVDRLVTANAYVGSPSIVEALNLGAEIVITGRVTDPSLILAPCIHHFGWKSGEWDKLAGGTVAGHLIECGTQVTGGISTDWLAVDDSGHIGFPIVEVAEDGSCTVYKPPGTGGCVSELTVKEQLLYEIGDPGHYLSPDVIVSFLTLQVDDQRNDRVRVSGATGFCPSDKLKVSATYRDGYRAAGTLTIVGHDAVQKAQRCGEIVLQRLREAGYELRDAVVECLGSGACLPAGIRTDQIASPLETVLRIAVESDSREAVESFSRELMPLITAGPQGITGYAEGRPRVHPVFRYWPCLVDRNRVTSDVDIVSTSGGRELSEQHGASGSKQQDDTGRGQSADQGGQKAEAPARVQTPTSEFCNLQSALLPATPSGSATGPRRLRDIACARSGDKGTGANVGTIARSPEFYPFLQDWLTADRVTEFFASLEVESVERFEVPNLHALNFLLNGILRNNLRTDAQGKTLGQSLLEMPLPDSF